VHSAPAEKVGLTANWSLDEFGITFRETYWGPQHGTSTPNNGGQVITFNQAGVGLTDLELRYNVTEQLQFAFGGNNVFNLHQDVSGFAGPPTGNALGNTSAGLALPFSNASVSNNFFGASWNPNGGYYYGRINFNF
jgi:iron complex outermembrane receptor protein